MSNRKMEWAIYTDPKTKESMEIKYTHINKDEYESKYRGNLTCINECDAKIKFTEKTNGTNFFSNSSNQGDKHDDGCQFGVEYKGRGGKLKLIAYYKELNVSKNDIKNSIKNKIKALKRKYNGEENNKKQTYTMKIDKIGETNVSGEGVSDNPNIDSQNGSKRRRIMSIDANHLTKDYIGVTKCIYGKARNAEIGLENGEHFGYINLKNDDYSVSVHCPRAFYSQENGINREEFIKLFDILKNEINNKNDKNFVVVCYGEIRKKKGKGVNIQIIDSDFVTINEMSMNEILYSGKINDVQYDVI